MPATVLGVRVDATTCADAVRRVVQWASGGDSRYVCVANVHMIMEAFDSRRFCQVLMDADMVVADGMPLVWMLRQKGNRGQQRVYGPELMQAVLANASLTKIPVGLLGSTNQVLAALRQRLSRDYPGLQLVYSESLPIGDAAALIATSAAERVARSGARTLFVALGCPKQELWMAANKGRVPAVMIGVGAAFDFLAGTKTQAPAWMGRNGLEWFSRLIHEPRRLWRRYLIHNSRFLVLATAELLGLWRPRC